MTFQWTFFASHHFYRIDLSFYHTISQINELNNSRVTDRACDIIIN